MKSNLPLSRRTYLKKSEILGANLKAILGKLIFLNDIKRVLNFLSRGWLDVVTMWVILSYFIF